MPRRLKSRANAKPDTVTKVETTQHIKTMLQTCSARSLDNHRKRMVRHADESNAASEMKVMVKAKVEASKVEAAKAKANAEAKVAKAKAKAEAKAAKAKVSE